MLNLRSSWNRQYHWRSSQQPRQSHLGGSGLPSRGYVTDRALGTGNTTGCQREPRNKTNLFLFAVLQNGLRSPIGDAVSILNAYNRNDGSCMLDLAHTHF